MGVASVSASEKLTTGKSVAFVELDGESVLLNIETGTYFGLDGAGTDIWNLLTNGASEIEIVANLLEVYDIETSQLQADVRVFLDNLLESGLVRRLDR